MFREKEVEIIVKQDQKVVIRESIEGYLFAFACYKHLTEPMEPMEFTDWFFNEIARKINKYLLVDYATILGAVKYCENIKRKGLTVGKPKKGKLCLGDKRLWFEKDKVFINALGIVTLGKEVEYEKGFNAYITESDSGRFYLHYSVRV